MLSIAQTDAFKKLPGHERHFSPMSEYLFKRVQPYVEDQLFLGKRYEALFDRLELFMALSTADLDDSFWGHPGRYAWKYRSRTADSSPFQELVAEAQSAGDDWPPLTAGFFRGSITRFVEISERHEAELLKKLGWY